MRKEIKYEISYQEYKSLIQVLDRVLERDIHSSDDGKYRIKSMYFDNHLHEIENNKLNDINSVKKYRIRMYNNDDSTIFLERKTNENGYMDKIKQKIDKLDVIDILEGNYKKILEPEESLKTELYLKLLLKQYRPAIVIEYERVAYRDRISNASITVDTKIKSSKNCSKFFEETRGEESKKYVLEIKYEEYLPDYIKGIIKSIESKKITKAKFITQITKYNNKE